MQTLLMKSAKVSCNLNRTRKFEFSRWEELAVCLQILFVCEVACQFCIIGYTCLNMTRVGVSVKLVKRRYWCPKCGFTHLTDSRNRTVFRNNTHSFASHQRKTFWNFQTKQNKNSYGVPEATELENATCLILNIQANGFCFLVKETTSAAIRHQRPS